MALMESLAFTVKAIGSIYVLAHMLKELDKFKTLNFFQLLVPIGEVIPKINN